MFKLVLDENSTDPHALAVQEYLQKFITRTVQATHGGKLDTYCASFDQLSITTNARLEATDTLLGEANSRIGSLHSPQAQHSESLTTLQQILLQQTATIQSQAVTLQ
jgi:hypothetical protein